ncbi:hypothetical protein CGRA01v4_08047 [Colletotrichum graminicola]|nr:hypothetical protein CGRA01v4_08047 [Colletotrichum graminicola]
MFLCFFRLQAVDFLFLLDQTILQADKMKRRVRDEGHGVWLMDVAARPQSVMRRHV